MQVFFCIIFSLTISVLLEGTQSKEEAIVPLITSVLAPDEDALRYRQQVLSRNLQKIEAHNSIA